MALAHALRRETGGNPFFVVEMILHLAQEGTFVQGDDGIWRLTVDLDEIGLPTSVREVVAQRVATLGEETERALSMASVIGRDFDLSVLAALLGDRRVGAEDLHGTVPSRPASCSRQGGRCRRLPLRPRPDPAHLVPRSDRRPSPASTPQRVAEVLEDTGSDDPERLAALARHWLAATRQADVTKAVYYARRAGQVALAAYAPADAVAWFSQALEVLDRHGAPDEHERGRLLVELGIAQNAAGMPEHQTDPPRRGRDRPAPRRRRPTDGGGPRAVAEVIGGMTEADPERAAILQAALSALGQGGSRATRALLLASLAEVTDCRDWRRRRELADEAVALADELDDAAKLDVMLSCYQFRTQPERSAERLAETAWACQTADRLGDPVLRYPRPLSADPCLHGGGRPG